MTCGVAGGAESNFVCAYITTEDEGSGGITSDPTMPIPWLDPLPINIFCALQWHMTSKDKETHLEVAFNKGILVRGLPV
jgi:hypothetical protein